MFFLRLGKKNAVTIKNVSFSFESNMLLEPSKSCVKAHPNPAYIVLDLNFSFMLSSTAGPYFGDSPFFIVTQFYLPQKSTGYLQVLFLPLNDNPSGMESNFLIKSSNKSEGISFGKRFAGKPLPTHCTILL